MRFFRIARLMATCALLIAVVFVAVTGLARTEVANRTAQNEAVVREAFDNWIQGGNVFAELLAPDVRWTIHGSGPVAGT